MSGEKNFTGHRVRLKCVATFGGTIYPAGHVFKCYNQIGAWCRVEGISHEIQQDYFEVDVGAPLPPIVPKFFIDDEMPGANVVADFARKHMEQLVEEYRRPYKQEKEKPKSDFENEVFE